ncbi:hypothetical protein LZ32DRAFT_605953 [Colletotrichum eremochloae]|nr:hypothetical protein LZ32DRAFT_605953 [Colletotrichum eremochloae]
MTFSGLFYSPTDYPTYHDYQYERATHVLHANPNTGEGDAYKAMVKQAQLRMRVTNAIFQLHNPFTNEDRLVLRQILGYLDQHRHDLVAQCISVDSNAPQVNVPATWLEVSDLAFEGIQTLDYPYLLRVMQAIDILVCGIWQEEKDANKENVPPEFVQVTGGQIWSSAFMEWEHNRSLGV